MARIRFKIKRIVLIIKILLHVPGYEWYSPWVREIMEKDKELYKLFEGA